MPIYEFECLKCGDGFEEFYRSASAKHRPTCPACGSRRVRKRFSVFATAGSQEGGESDSSCASCTRTSCAGCKG